jgi:hypothetical protein
MKLLKAVWAEMTIKGKFKGSLQEFAIRNVDHGNKVFAGPKQVTSTFEAMALDPNKLFIDEVTMTCCEPKIAGEQTTRVGCDKRDEIKKDKKTSAFKPDASLKKTAGSSIADIFFNPAQQTIDCPHCHLPMKTATLNGGMGSLFCPNCRHVDYEDKVKSTVNAGSPSVDKSLQFKCLDSGNCQIV